MLGTTELIVILVIVVVIFGGQRLPELGSGIGKAIRNFKKATSEPDEIDVSPDKGEQVKIDEKEKEKNKTA